jgi:hypothetical protein
MERDNVSDSKAKGLKIGLVPLALAKTGEELGGLG